MRVELISPSPNILIPINKTKLKLLVKSINMISMREEEIKVILILSTVFNSTVATDKADIKKK